MFRIVSVLSFTLSTAFASFSATADIHNGTLDTSQIVIPLYIGGIDSGESLRGDMHRIDLGSSFSGSDYDVLLDLSSYDVNTYGTAIAFATDPNVDNMNDPVSFLNGLAIAYSQDQSSHDTNNTNVQNYLSTNIDGFQYAFAVLPPGSNDLNAIRYSEDRGPINFQSGADYYAFVGIIGGPISNSNSNYVTVDYSLTVAAVPEAETWLMMLVGLAGIGAWIKRKPKANAKPMFA